MRRSDSTRKEMKTAAGTLDRLCLDQARAAGDG